MATVGRPKTPYDPEIADEICERISESESGIEEILYEMKLTFGDRVPSIRVIYRWLAEIEEFREKSARAKTLQADLLFDRAQKYAREALIGITRSEETTDEKRTVVIKSGDNVERAKLLVQTTLRRAGQLNPKKYGEKQQIELTGDSGLAEAIKKGREAVRARKKEE